MLRKHLYLIAIILLHASFSWAQRDSITMFVVCRDQFTRESLQASLTVMDADSIALQTLTPLYSEYNKAYFFEIKEKRLASYILKASHKGYEASFTDVVLKKSDGQYKELKEILLTRAARKMGEVTVEASKVLMVHRGDTTIYDATMFTLSHGSMLDALISRLPGVQINSNGQIWVNGQFVSSLLVNGREFFRGDPSVALRNLPAYYVDKVKVYHKWRILTPDSTKVDKRDAPLAMDVILKREYAQGWIANAEAACGTSERYLFRFFSMRYTTHSGLFLFGNANNLNNVESPDRKGNWGFGNWGDGLLRSKSGGINLNIDGKKLKSLFDTSLKVDARNVDSESRTSVDNFFTTGDTYNRDHTKGRTEDIELTWKGNFEYEGYKTGRKGALFLKPDVQFCRTENSGLTQGASFLSSPEESYRGASLDTLYSPLASERLEQALINRVEARHTGKSHQWKTNGTTNAFIPIHSKFLTVTTEWHSETKHKQLHSSLDIQYPVRNENDATEKDVFQKSYERLPERENTVKVWLGMPTLRLRKGKYLIHSAYAFSHNYSWRDRTFYRQNTNLTYSESECEPTMLSSASDSLQAMVDWRNSFNTRTRTNQHGIELSADMKLRHGSLTLHLPFSHDSRRITDRRSLQQQTHTRSSIHFQPRLSWQARYERQEFLAIASRKVQPMPLNYLLDVRDDTDPLNISTGNSTLKDECVWSFSFRHARRNTPKRRDIASRASSSIIQNAIAMSKSYDKATGVSVFRPMNVQGNWTASAGVTATQWFSWQSAMIESSADVTYAHNVDFVSETLAQSGNEASVRNLYADWSLKAQCHMRKATFVLHGSLKWRNGSSRQEYFHSFNVADAGYGVSVVCPLPWKLRIESDMRMCHRWGYRDRNMNDGILLWDATLSRSIGHTNQFTLKLDAHDILRQTSSVRHTLNAMGQSETWYRTLPSYVLLRVGYQFHKKPKERK